MKTSEQLTFKTAHDEPNEHSMELSPKPAGKQGYVLHERKWRLATSNGKVWVLEDDDE